ncbi:unnamed protein product, partial [Closterium sp. NIES-53]
GCSPSPLAPSYASAAAADVSDAEDVRAASASAKRRSSKGKGGKGGGGGSGSSGGGSSGGGGGGGTGGGSGGSGGGSGGNGGSGGGGGSGTGGGGTGAWHVGSGGGQRQQQQRRGETLSPQQLREWFLRGASGGSCPYVIRTGDHAGQTCGRLHTQHRCFSRLDDAWRAEFGDDVELPRWADLLSAEGDCYQCVPPDPGIAATALGASESGTLPGTALAQALHTFTLDSGASACFFRDSTTLTPLSTLVPVRLADPSRGPVVARSSTILPFPAVPSGSLSGLHLPSFSTNMVSTTALQDAMVTTTTPGGSSMYTLATKPPQVAASAQVSAPGQVAASCSCCLLSHQTLLWHLRGLGHPSLPCLRGMHSRLLVSGLSRSLPPLPPLTAPPCLPCVEGWQRAAPHSSSFPPTTAPLQTLHMDVWGPARFSGQSREHYFQQVVDDYTLYTTVVPLRSKEVVSSPPTSCHGEGILQSFTLPDSPQQNGIADRRISLVMEVARTSMFHAAAPHFLWPLAVRYAAHQLNLWPRVSLPETPPTLRWTGEDGDALVFCVWGSRAFVRDTSADKLSQRAIPFDSLALSPTRLAGSFTTPPHAVSSLLRTLRLTSRFLFTFSSPTALPPLLPQGPAPSGVSQVDPLLGPALVQVAVDSGAASGGVAYGGAEPGVAESEGAETGGAEPGGVETGGAEPEAAELGDAASEGAGSRGAEPQGAASSGGSGGASRRLSPQQLREWFIRRAHLRSGATGAGGAGAAGAGGAGVVAGAGATRGNATTGPGGARTRGTGAARAGGVEGAGAGDATESGATGADGSNAGGSGAGGAGVGGIGAGGAGSGGLTKRRKPASRPVLPVCTAPCIPRSRPPLVSGTHAMALHPSSVPLRVPLPAPPESSLPEAPDPESDRARSTSPTVSRLLATAVTNPSFESAAASALVAELLDFAAAYRLDYATALVAESMSASPPSVGGECALGMDVLEDMQEDFECLAAAVPRFPSMLLAPEGDPDAPDIPTPRSYAKAITGPYSSQWQAAMDAEMASWKSTGTYVDEFPPPGANIVDGMWIFRLKRPPGSPPAFKARYVAQGFSQQKGVDFFQTFSPTPKMTTLRVLLHVAAQRDYELHSLDFSTTFLQGSLHEEIWLRRPLGFTETTLAVLGFAPATADPSLFLRTDTLLPPFYVLVYVDDLVFATADTEALTLITRDRARRTSTLTQSHMVHHVLQCFGFQFSSPQPTPLSTSHSLSAPPSDEFVEPSGPHPELVGCLMYLMTYTRPDLAYPLSLLARYVAPVRHRKVHFDAAKRVLRYLCSTSGMGLVLGGWGPLVLTGHADASWVDDSATQRLSQSYTFSLCSGFVSWRSTCSSSVLSSSCESEIYAGAMAAQELRWLTYLLTDLGEQPRSPPVLYVDNKAMSALC